MNKNAVIRTLVLLASLSGGLLTAQEDEAPTKKAKKPSAATLEAKKQKAIAKNKAAAEAKAHAVDLNRATKAQLKRLPGLTEAQVDAIIAKRPHSSKTDVVTKGIISADAFQGIRALIAVRLPLQDAAPAKK